LLDPAVIHLSRFAHPWKGGVGRNSKAEKRSAHDAGEDDASVGEEFGVPWLPLLHLWVHEVASREKLLRK